MGHDTDASRREVGANNPADADKARPSRNQRKHRQAGSDDPAIMRPPDGLSSGEGLAWGCEHKEVSNEWGTLVCVDCGMPMGDA